MMRVKIILLIGILSATSFLQAQEKWTLQNCIDYARKENIQVKQSEITTQGYEIDILQSKAALFPSLSGSISQRFSNAKYDDGTGNYKYEGLFNGQYGLNASWTVFNGSKNLNNIKQAKLEKKSSELNSEEIKNNIEISITQTYLQILYASESIKNNENILASSEAELNQSKILLDAGSITKSEYAQIEAQYSTYKYNLVVAQNAYDAYIIQLKQLLELDLDTTFDVEIPTIDESSILQLVPNTADIYRTSLAIMPQIKSSELAIDIANVSKSSAKAGYLPTLSVTGSLGSSNIYNQSPSFTTQLDRNFTQSIGLTLSIPIFDNRQNKSAVQKANLQIQSAQLDYLNTQKELLSTVETLRQEVIAGQNKYLAAKESLKATELSYQLTSDKYNAGASNSLTLVTEKNNYANALQELLQAKYTTYMNLRILNFYMGKETSF